MTAKFKQLRHFVVPALFALGLAGCATPGHGPAGGTRQAQPLAELQVATPDAGHDLMAYLLAGEMALARNQLKAAAADYAQAARLSGDPDVSSRAFELALAVHDDTAAAAAIARWRAIGASKADLAQARARLALDTGDTDTARRELTALVESGDPQAWRAFGRALVGARDPAQAAQLLEALATPERLPAEPEAWLAMSQLGRKLGRTAYAARVADAAVRRFHQPETYVWAARLKLEQGERDAARDLMRQALARSPTDPRVRLGYAGLLSQTGDYATAARVLDRGPQTEQTYALRAALAAHMHDQRALERLYRQVRQAPEAVRGHSAFLLGQLAEMLGHREQALDWYDQVDDGDEHAFEADLRSAVILHEQGRRARAHGLLEQLQAAYLDAPEELRRAYEADAELYMRERDYARAATTYGRALKVLPDTPELLYGRGLAWAEAGQTDRAVADFRRVLALRPGDVEATNALGYTLADAGRDLPEAKHLLEQARAAKPDDPAIADSWGWLQFRLGHLDQAAQVLRHAWKARKDADVGVHLAEVLWHQGRRDEARQIFRQVRRIDPKSASLRAALERLGP